VPPPILLVHCKNYGRLVIRRDKKRMMKEIRREKPRKKRKENTHGS